MQLLYIQVELLIKTFIKHKDILKNELKNR